MDKTKEIDLLMKQIDKQLKIVDSRTEYVDRVNNFKELNTGNAKYDELLKAHKLTYKSRKTSDLKSLTETKLFFANLENQFDQELFNLLQLNIQFSVRKNARTLGSASKGNITINISSDTYEEKDIQDVAAHELGHNWAFQLHHWTHKSETNYLKEVVTNFLYKLDLISKEQKTKSFRYLKPYLKKHVTWYAGTTWTEAFAEVFAYSCMEIDRKSLYYQARSSKLSKERTKIIVAKEVIDDINIKTKQAIMKYCMAEDK